jgi:hypothetical protein
MDLPQPNDRQLLTSLKESLTVIAVALERRMEGIIKERNMYMLYY